MKSQEVLDSVVNHLRKQNARSTRVVKYIKRDEIESAYRGDDGRKCPAGFLMTDEEYKVEMEGTTFGSLLALATTDQALKDKYKAHIDLIDALNFLHDWSPVEEWEEDFSDIATLFGLKYKAPKKAKEEKPIEAEVVVAPIVIEETKTEVVET